MVLPLFGHPGEAQTPFGPTGISEQNAVNSLSTVNAKDTNPSAVGQQASIKAATESSTASAGSRPYWSMLPIYRDPANEATTYVQTSPTVPDGDVLARQGGVPTAMWFGDWTPNVQAETNSYVADAARVSAVPILALYAIPQRDCGGFSAGGVGNASAYISWVRSAAAGIGNRLAVVVLEPDALASMDCLSAADQQTRFSIISQAVSILKANRNAYVYIDAGNPAWQTAGTMAQRLKAANIDAADGFSLNVSNYVSTARNQAYGDQISAQIGNKHYIIDTSRNGNTNVRSEDWCNATNAALGALPTTSTGNMRNDALLWVKIPWESDGTCNGGPEAGMVFWSFAAALARNAGW